MFEAAKYQLLAWSAAALGMILAVGLLFAWMSEASLKRSLAAMTGDRDQLVTLGEKICGVVGLPLKAPKRADWGRACFDQVVDLQKFRNDASDQTNQILIDNHDTQLAKMKDDLARALRDKSLAFKALDALKEAATHVPESNEVGADYYRALNRTAGLRDTPLTDPAG
jgi:hypothetical protein